MMGTTNIDSLDALWNTALKPFMEGHDLWRPREGEQVNRTDAGDQISKWLESQGVSAGKQRLPRLYRRIQSMVSGKSFTTAAYRSRRGPERS